MSRSVANTRVKKADDLSVADFQEFPVWRFTNAHEEELDETAVAPVQNLPADIGGGCIVGVKVQLSNGTECWAMLGNIDPTNPRKTEHFRTLTVFKDGDKFHLARYHDFGSSCDPSALAVFLNIPIDQVFPVRYDLTGFCIGDTASLAGEFNSEPNEILNASERMALIFS